MKSCGQDGLDSIVSQQAELCSTSSLNLCLELCSSISSVKQLRVLLVVSNNFYAFIMCVFWKGSGGGISKSTVGTD